MIKCPDCNGSLGWANKQTEWKCRKCGMVFAEYNRDTKQFNCSICGKDLGYPLYSCECWKHREMKPEYIEERRKQFEKQKDIEFNVLSKPPLPTCMLDKMYEFLKEVYPRHVDQFAFFNGEKHLLTVFPGLEQWTGYSDYKTDMPWLKKSRFQLKGVFKLSDIDTMKAYSEEVKEKRQVSFGIEELASREPRKEPDEMDTYLIRTGNYEVRIKDETTNIYDNHNFKSFELPTTHFKRIIEGTEMFKTCHERATKLRRVENVLNGDGFDLGRLAQIRAIVAEK